MKLSNSLKYLLCGALISTLLFSCKDDDNTTTSPVVYPNYSQLKVGNYWIYQRFDIDSSGNASATNIYDSCYVEKDTVINGSTFFKVHRPDLSPGLPSDFYWRDSLQYVVNNTGEIIFSSRDFNTTFKQYYIIIQPGDTVSYVTTKMAEKDWIKVTPGGSFITSNYKTNFNMYPNWILAGNPRILNTRYSEGVGIVSETFHFFASSPNYTERRLVNYHLN